MICKLKLNCHDMRRVTVMTSSSQQVSKLRSSWSIHSCFHLCKNCENRSRNARLTVEKLVAFFRTRCIMHTGLLYMRPVSMSRLHRFLFIRQNYGSRKRVEKKNKTDKYEQLFCYILGKFLVTRRTKVVDFV